MYIVMYYVYCKEKEGRRDVCSRVERLKSNIFNQLLLILPHVSNFTPLSISPLTLHSMNFMILSTVVQVDQVSSPPFFKCKLHITLQKVTEVVESLSSYVTISSTDENHELGSKNRVREQFKDYDFYTHTFPAITEIVIANRPPKI